MSRIKKISKRTLAVLALFLAGGWLATSMGVYAPPAPQIPGAPYAAVTATPEYAAAIAEARKVALEVHGRGAPGLAVAVGVNGAIVWAEGFGYADVENRVPVWPTTRFRIGSVSKPVTAAAVARLIEAGKLDLDAPVQKYVPYFPDKGAVITTRLAGGHLAGLRHYRGEEFLLNRRFNSVRESLTIFQDDPLLHPPGSRYSYSSYGWNLVSAVVEGASGEEFLAYMDKTVFGPLGMRHTVPDWNHRIIEHRTRFYQRTREGELQNAPAVDNSYKWAGGGFLSTVEDLVRFGSAHLRPGFLKKETLDVLFTSQKTAEGKETGYGIGWSSRRDAAGRRIVTHGGGSIGGTTQLAVYLDGGVVVAMVANLSGAQLRPRDYEAIAAPFLK